MFQDEGPTSLPFCLISQSKPSKGLSDGNFLGDANAMENSGQILFLQDPFLMKRVNDTAFLVFSKEDAIISVTCKLDTELLKMNRMMTVDINLGCTAFANLMLACIFRKKIAKLENLRIGLLKK